MYEKSEQNPHAVLIDYAGRKYWIDTNDPDAEFELVLFEDAVAIDNPTDYKNNPLFLVRIPERKMSKYRIEFMQIGS